MNTLEKYAAQQLLIEKLAAAWNKLAASMAAVKPPPAPGKATKGAGIPAPKNPAAKTSNIKPIKVSMNTRGAMPQ
jgi:hypothetical protein